MCAIPRHVLSDVAGLCYVLLADPGVIPQREMAVSLGRGLDGNGGP